MAHQVVTGGSYKNITATANLSPIPATVIGVLCSSTTGGTLILYDSATTTTTDPVTGTITLTAGQFYQIPASTESGIYAVIANTANITVFWAP